MTDKKVEKKVLSPSLQCCTEGSSQKSTMDQKNHIFHYGALLLHDFGCI